MLIEPGQVNGSRFSQDDRHQKGGTNPFLAVQHDGCYSTDYGVPTTQPGNKGWSGGERASSPPSPRPKPKRFSRSFGCYRSTRLSWLSSPISWKNQRHTNDNQKVSTKPNRIGAPRKSTFLKPCTPFYNFLNWTNWILTRFHCILPVRSGKLQC